MKKSFVDYIWSCPVGSIAGIPIKLHLSLTLVMAFFLLGGLLVGEWFGVQLFGLIVFSVLLHELGHCFVARHYGVQPESILLTIIGGLAKIKIPYNRPRAEFFTTLAGPLVSFYLACVFLLAAYQFNYRVLWMMVYLNGAILFFANGIIPAFPLDGGRLFRSSLAAITGNPVRATVIAVNISKGCCVALFIAGIYFGIFMLPIIVVVLWLGASSELRLVTLDLLKECNSKAVWCEMVKPHEAVIHFNMTPDVSYSKEEIADLEKLATTIPDRELSQDIHDFAEGLKHARRIKGWLTQPNESPRDH